jgi:hypothetical protein
MFFEVFGDILNKLHGSNLKTFNCSLRVELIVFDLSENQIIVHRFAFKLLL